MTLPSSLPTEESDRRSIDSLVARFFCAFSNRNGRADVSSVHQLAIKEAVIVRNVGPRPEIYNLEQFLSPRETLLSDGTLVDFEEVETWSRTDVLGSIAQRLSLYRKSGVLSGIRFETRGVKTFQFVRTPLGWKISAAAWDDEREGLRLPDVPSDPFEG